MNSQSSIDNYELDKKYIDSLIHLFKSRNNLKYPVDSPEFKIVETLPVFDRNQINIFSSKIKSKEDIKDALMAIGFQNNYQYNPSQLQEIQSQYPPDVLIIVIYFQILARIYFQDKLTTDDFALLLEAISNLFSKANKDLINSAFYILYLKMQSSRIIWSEQCVQQVLLFFERNNSLSSNYYNILVHYLSLFIQANEEDKQTIRILKMLQLIFKLNYPIIHVPDLSKIVDLIHPLLFNFNYDSLLVFAYMSKVDKESTEKDIRIFPEFFTTLALKNADMQNMNIKVAKQEKIHELPAVYTGGIPDMEYKIQNIDTFHNKLYPIPIELYKRNNQLGNLIPENTRTIIKTSLRDFFEVLDPELTKIFFQEMNKALVNCMNSNDYNGFAAYLFLLHYSLTNSNKTTTLSKQYLDENIPYFFPKQKFTNKKSNNEISFGDMFYNPENTVFGPYALDPIINIFRTSILFLTTSTNLYRFIESMKGCPFLMAEQIGRLCLRFDAEIFSTFNQSSEKIFKILSREMIVLQMKNAQIGPRNTFFLFFVHLLTDEKKVGDYLKSNSFVDSIFRFIFETGIMDKLIVTITRSFLLLNNDTFNKVNIESSVAFLYKAAQLNNEIAPKIYRMVADILKYRPIFIRKFDRFFELMMNELQNKQTKESFDNAFTLLELMANYYNQQINDNDSFKFFSPKYFRIIASHLKFATYEKLFNLVAGGYNLDTKGIFLIKQPYFIPLLFIAYANDYQKINSLIEQFLILATKSELNCRAFHDGDLDLILLMHLNRENPLKYKGFEIPQLKINERVENTTVINLLTLIISAKSDFTIAKKIMEIIIKRQDIRISKMTNNILAYSEIIPSPSYAIGSLDHFCTITGLNDKQLKGDLSITFWIKTDPIPFTNTTACVDLISIIDKNEFIFSIAVQNNLLFASFETKKKKTSVCLCQRMSSNEWTHFAITVSNSPTQSPLISTYKNFEKLHDSEFCNFEFNPGPIGICFGGHTYDDRTPVFTDMKYGSISRIFIYNRFITTSEIVSILENRDTMPKDFVASLNVQSNNERNISTNIFMNHYVIESLKSCLSNEQVISRFIESLKTISSRPLIDQIFTILNKIISFSKNKTISSHLASILLNSDYADHRLYKTIESIVSKIKDKDTQKCWIEDILINVQIWCHCDTFDVILHDYSKLLINYPQFFNNWFFYYFLNQFNILVNTDKEKRDEKALNEFLMFIERYPVIRGKNEINIDKVAVNDLICFATNASDDDKVIYLEIIEKIADAINFVGFNEYEYIFYFISMKNIDISLHAILAIHQLLMKNFHAVVYSILDVLTIPLDELFTRLEPYVKKYKNLFSLTCAIGLQTGQNPSQFPFSLTLSPCWFVFPLLSAMVTTDNMLFIDLIARNAVKSKDINLIMFMTTYLNLFGEQNYKKNSNNVLQNFLLALYRNHRAEPSLERKFQIFFHLFAASFFKMNAPLMRGEIANIIQPKPEPAKQVKKIKVIDFHTLTQLVKNAEAFINEIDKPRNELRNKYFEMKRIRDAIAAQNSDNNLVQQNEPKPDDEEFTHLEGIIESVKSYQLQFYFTKADLEILKAAYTIFTHYLKDYKIEGIQSESSGTFFKTKVPAFGFEDLRLLMAKFIQMYPSVNSNNVNETFNERRLSLDSSSSSNQLNNTNKSSNLYENEGEDENIRLSKNDDNLSGSNHLLRNPFPQVDQSSTNSQSQFVPTASASPPSSSSLPQSSPLTSPSREPNEQQNTNVNLHPIAPYEKQIKIFDYFVENLNSNMNIINFAKILQMIKPQKEFKKKIAPINSETCTYLIKSEEERAKKQRIIAEKTVQYVRSNVLGYSITPFLMKRQKSVQPVYRYHMKTSALTSPNAKLINFEDKTDLNFEVPLSAELNEQLLIQLQQEKQQQEKQQQQLQQQQQQQQQQQPTQLSSAPVQRRTNSQTQKLSHFIRLSGSMNTSSAHIFTNERYYIIETKSKRICIDKTRIVNIFYIDTQTIELVDNQNQPYLIQFNSAEEATMNIKRIKIEKQCKFLITPEFNIANRYRKKEFWSKGMVSTFNFLSVANFLSGRTYEDSSKYPIFPSLTPMNKITNNSFPSLNLTFFQRKNNDNSDSSVQYENRKFVLPELYYLFESDNIENVYQRRKKLEELSKTDKQNNSSCLLKWIEKIFNFNQVSRQIFTNKIAVCQTFLEMDTESKILYAIPFYKDSSFCMILSTGEVRFFSVQITEKVQPVEHTGFLGKKKKTETATEVEITIENISPNNQKYELSPKDLSTLKFAPLNVGYIPDITALFNKSIKFGLIAYNRNTIHFVDLNGKVTKENVYLDNPIFHNAVVRSTPSTIVSISSFLALPNKQQSSSTTSHKNAQIDNNKSANYDTENYILCNVHSKITCLQSSCYFGIIAFGSDDCKVRIRALNDGAKIATVSLDESEVPTMLLITESWGFVVVYCVTKMYILSVNGKLVKTCSNFKPFNQWFTFKSADDFDYIAIRNEDEEKLEYFEVMYPDNVKELIMNGNIAAMRYEPRYNCFIFLSENGRVTLIPADI